MGKKEQDLQKQEQLLKTLGDFTSKENWDSFFTIRGSGDAFEWYAEWPQLKNLLKTHLCSSSDEDDVVSKKEELQVLVPGCGNSKLSEHLYDAGFHNITNIDFSKVVISDMLRRNVRSRPGMKWRVMDMTKMQFADESFGAIVDKGGLDALMEPELGVKLGNQYLSEVKRVLKVGGRFICLTLAESHVLGLLFPKFRYGWKIGIHPIAQKPSDKSGLQTFMVVAEKHNSSLVCQIQPVDQSSSRGPMAQFNGLLQALENENKIRAEYSSGSDILYSLEDLKIGAKGNLVELSPGRRAQLTLGELGISQFCYRAVLLDAQKEYGPFSYQYGVFLVPKARAYEWLFSSEEGQWVVVESSKAARLVMILLDSSQSNASMEDVQKDLSPLVMELAPGDFDNEAQIPFMAASDGIKERKIVHEVTSALTGPIIVDDVIYEKVDENISRLYSSNDVTFRRLTFQRTESLVQSEAVLSREGSQKVGGEINQKKGNSSSNPRKKGSQKRSGSNIVSSDGLSIDFKVDHSYLASSYHTGIISGFMLISSHLGSMASSGDMVKVVVIGLGAGLLPMFLYRCLSFAEIKVLELDPVVLHLAKDYFGFIEDERLKVNITDGVKYVKDVASEVAIRNENNTSDEKIPASNGCSSPSHEKFRSAEKIDMLIVDVDSSDSSSGLSCPAADFVDESFIKAAKDSLSDQGLLVINLVSRSQAIKDMIYSRLQMVFPHLFQLQLDEDVNEVIFALKTETCIMEDSFNEASQQLARLLNLENFPWGQNIMEATKKIKKLR